MDEHRLVDAGNYPTTIPFQPPEFSSFRYVEENYGEENQAIRRLFSIARSRSACTLMVEHIEPAGIILEENNEIRQYIADYEMKGLHRISFWKSSFAAPNATVCRQGDCIGYAILKRDKAFLRVPSDFTSHLPVILLR